MRRNFNGQTLIEVILVTFLFGVLGTGMVATLITSAQSSKRGVDHTASAGYIKEAIEAVRSIRDRDWSELVNGTHGLSTAVGYYDFAGTSDTLDSGEYTRTTTIEDVYRVGSLTGAISASGTVFDAASKRVTVNVVWSATDGQMKNLDAVFYVFNSDQESWVQSTTADFNAGGENSTDIATADNGEVVLRAHNADWENVEVLWEIDLASGGDRHEVYADPDADILYVLGENAGGDNFHALDVSDVSENEPTLIDSALFTTAQDFASRDGFVYVAGDESGLGGEIVIIDGATLTTVATIDLDETEEARGVDVFGDTLVIARALDGNTDEAVFFDVGTPSSPTLLGGADPEVLLNDVVYDGTYAYVVTNEDAAEVMAIRRSDFAVLDTLDLTGTSNAGAVDLFGSTLYVGKDNNSGEELFAIDVSNPASLVVLATIEVSQSVEGLQVDVNGQYAVAGTRHEDKEFFTIDLATFTEAHSGDTYGGSQAESVSVFGGHGYIGSTSNVQDVSILRVAPGGWDDVELVGSADLSGNHDESVLWVEGNYVYLANENNGSNHDFYVYDITTPASPTYLGSIDTNSDVNDITVSGNYAYLATKDNSREVIVIDVTTKTSPTQVGSYNAAGSRDGTSIALFGTTLYLGREDGSDPDLYVLSLATPASPSYVGSTDYGADLERTVADGSYVYAATEHDTQELAIFDVSNPATPSYVGSYDVSGSEDGQAIDVSGTTVVLGRDDGSGPELAIIDVTTPSAPAYLGGTDVDEEVNGVALEGTAFVHVAADDWQAQYQRWDISNPALPTLETSYDLQEDGEAIFFDGVYAYAGSEDNDQELWILGPLTPPGDYVREGNFTSQAFDAGEDTSWDSIEWMSAGSGSVSFRIRTADTQANLATAKWVGSGGDPGAVYSTSGGALATDPNATGRRWFQWKAYVTGDGASTPSLEEVTVRYSQ